MPRSLRPVMTVHERTPLLPSREEDVGSSGGCDPDRAIDPLELPCSTRYSILFGVWIANFLSVSANPHDHAICR